MNKNGEVLLALRDQWHSRIRQQGLVALGAAKSPVADAAAAERRPYRRRPGAGTHQGPQAERRGESSHFLGLADVLPRSYFLSHLRREKRRTDRTAVPLSIALFHFDSERNDETTSVGELLDLLQRTKRETDVVGSLGGDSIAVLLPDTDRQGAQVLTERIVNRVRIPPVSTVTVTYPDQLFDKLIEESQALPDFSPFDSTDFTDPATPGYLLKRGLDILGALFALLLFSPVILMTAVAVALTSPGPVIYKQVRLGKGGVPFVFYKFRSMFCDADDRIHREYVANLIKGNLEEINNGSAAQPFYKMKSDPRVTPVGRFIRETHIDELPQLFNVLKGDMSLVGPRPPLPYEVEKYQAWHLRRILDIKPGVTGLWQVDGHNTTTFDDMVRIDLRYIRSCSLSLDISILFRTAKVVLDRLFA